MLIVGIAFAVVFLFRDMQILAVKGWRILAMRFVCYALLLLTGLALFSGSGFIDAPARWTERQFAFTAIFVQLLELAVALALKRYAMGRYSWLGFILPAPAFLVALGIISLEVQSRVFSVGAIGALNIVVIAWLFVVGGLVAVLCWLDDPWMDRKFASDFALMTSCTALIFFPFGLS
jgi:hypothetical protein